MSRNTHGWRPNTHPLVAGANWSIGRSRDALVALRGRSGARVEEIRLVDRTRPRKQDWASNTFVIKIAKGTLDSDNESAGLYHLCRAWWQHRNQLAELDAGVTFVVESLGDGRSAVRAAFRGTGTHTTDLAALDGTFVLRATDPRHWETRGAELLSMAVRLLHGDEVDASAFYLANLAESY